MDDAKRITYEHYIGVKQILATPMNRQEYNDYRGWELPADEDGSDEGYLVEYLDGGKSNHPDHRGYISWSPKDVFERAYKPTHGMTFGLAIEAMKLGKKVSRTGWNGKNMWLRYYDPYLDKQFPISEIEPAEGTPIPWIGMKTAQEQFVPWLASQSDILGEDWFILGEE